MPVHRLARRCAKACLFLPFIITLLEQEAAWWPQLVGLLVLAAFGCVCVTKVLREVDPTGLQLCFDIDSGWTLHGRTQLAQTDSGSRGVTVAHHGRFSGFLLLQIAPLTRQGVDVAQNWWRRLFAPRPRHLLVFEAQLGAVQWRRLRAFVRLYGGENAGGTRKVSAAASSISG